MYLGQRWRHPVAVDALCAAGPVAAQAPVPDPVSGQQVAGPLVAPAAEGQEALVLKHLCLHDSCIVPVCISSSEHVARRGIKAL